VPKLGTERFDIKDIGGQKFNYLTAILPIAKSATWLFLCDCGRTKAYQKHFVVTGAVKSCGCFYRRGQLRRHNISQRLTDGASCEICHRSQGSKKLDIDHDHRCCPQGQVCVKCVRGRLCQQCNKALGLFQDDVGILESALEYLRRFNAAVRL
jgi:hypothetical protein